MRKAQGGEKPGALEDLPVAGRGHGAQGLHRPGPQF